MIRQENKTDQYNNCSGYNFTKRVLEEVTLEILTISSNGNVMNE